MNKNFWNPGYTTKQINWSYPSSPNAAKFGFDRKGCWTVALVDGQSVNEAHGFESFKEAKAYADSLPFNYHRHSATVKA